jgi:hypothetical protein
MFPKYGGTKARIAAFGQRRESAVDHMLGRTNIEMSLFLLIFGTTASSARRPFK